MGLERVLDFSKSLLKSTVGEGEIAVDATVGNGHDTVFLAGLTGRNGHVYGFDIQPEAIEQTRKRLQKHGLADRVTLFSKGHEKAGECLPDLAQGRVAGAIFNLGYLPGSDKVIVTKPETTVSAVSQLIGLLRPGGLIVLVVYHGHEGGEAERDRLLDFAGSLDQQLFQVLQYSFINQKNHAPFIVAIEKK